MSIEGDNVYCDCCGTELMAKVVGDNLVIKDRRHGKIHMAIIPLKSLLDKAGYTGLFCQTTAKSVPERATDPLL